MKQCALIIFALLVFQGCVEKLGLPESVYQKHMVVDGLLTDANGPHTIALFFSNSAGDKSYEPITGASVAVTDGDGESHTFTETTGGEYVSAGTFIGQIGQKYTLHIVVNGKEYTSSPQTMYPAGEISNIYAEFEPGSINPGSFDGPRDSFTVWIDANSGEASDHGLFRWRTKGTYEVRTFPELHKKVQLPKTNPPRYISDPLPCSGFYYDSVAQQVIRTGVCECCNCWIDEYGGGALISDERFVVNKEFSRVFVARIPIDPARFYRKYHIEVEQLSLNEDIYSFWKVVKSQQNDGIFQPNTSVVRGNIYNVDDPSEVVLGMFAVSAVRTKTIMIYREDIPVDVGLIDSSTNACYKTYLGSTNVKPPFW